MYEEEEYAVGLSFRSKISESVDMLVELLKLALSILYRGRWGAATAGTAGLAVGCTGTPPNIMSASESEPPDRENLDFGSLYAS